MSVASQLSFGNAAVLTSGTLPGARGATASDDLSTFVAYSGNTITAGKFNNSSTEPNATTRLNYNGSLHATNIIASAGITGPAKPRIVTLADSLTITINADITDIAVQINTQSISTLTINAMTGTPFDGQKVILRLKSTNTQQFIWNATFAGSADLQLPLVATGSDKYDYMGFIYNAASSKWHLLAKNFGF